MQINREMKTIHATGTVEEDGDLHVRGLPCRRGDSVDVIVLLPDGKRATARQLLDSEILGMWADRTDIGDSGQYARTLRSAAEQRGTRAE